MLDFDEGVGSGCVTGRRHGGGAVACCGGVDQAVTVERCKDSSSHMFRFQRSCDSWIYLELGMTRMMPKFDSFRRELLLVTTMAGIGLARKLVLGGLLFDFDEEKLADKLRCSAFQAIQSLCRNWWFERMELIWPCTVSA